jgi:hypothetical protein
MRKRLDAYIAEGGEQLSLLVLAAFPKTNSKSKT